MKGGRLRKGRRGEHRQKNTEFNTEGEGTLESGGGKIEIRQQFTVCSVKVRWKSKNRLVVPCFVSEDHLI